MGFFNMLAESESLQVVMVTMNTKHFNVKKKRRIESRITHILGESIIIVLVVKKNYNCINLSYNFSDFTLLRIRRNDLARASLEVFNESISTPKNSKVVNHIWYDISSKIITQLSSSSSQISNPRNLFQGIK